MMSGGWAQATLNNYSSGVAKLLKFAERKGYSRKEVLPLSKDMRA